MPLRKRLESDDNLADIEDNMDMRGRGNTEERLGNLSK